MAVMMLLAMELFRTGVALMLGMFWVMAALFSLLAAAIDGLKYMRSVGLRQFRLMNPISLLSMRMHLRKEVRGWHA